VDTSRKSFSLFLGDAKVSGIDNTNKSFRLWCGPDDIFIVLKIRKQIGSTLSTLTFGVAEKFQAAACAPNPDPHNFRRHPQKKETCSYFGLLGSGEQGGNQGV
jgi:hypothetical protein